MPYPLISSRNFDLEHTIPDKETYQPPSSPSCLRSGELDSDETGSSSSSPHSANSQPVGAERHVGYQSHDVHSKAFAMFATLEGIVPPCPRYRSIEASHRLFEGLSRSSDSVSKDASRRCSLMTCLLLHILCLFTTIFQLLRQLFQSSLAEFRAHVAHLYKTEFAALEESFGRWQSQDEVASGDMKGKDCFGNTRQQTPQRIPWGTWSNTRRIRREIMEGRDIETARPPSQDEYSTNNQYDGGEWYEYENWVFP